MPRANTRDGKRKAPPPTGLSLRIFAAACCDATSVSRQLAVLAALLLAGLLLPAMLATLARILGLLTGLLLPAVLTALVRVVLALLLVSHIYAPCLPPRHFRHLAHENASPLELVPGTRSDPFTSL
jgi:hypothetical protein